jgi:holliday junction DNA helicase RuvA
MIAALTGVVAARSGDTILLHTDGGVGYELVLPLGVMERLPALGQRVSLHTELVVREDAWTLYGFDRPADRVIFQRLLGASGFGPRLALALLSTLGPERTVRAVQGRDIAALATVPGIGRKKAERLVLELSDRFGDLPAEPGAAPRGSAAEEAARALVTLGYPAPQADDAVRAALAAGSADDATALIRAALRLLMGSKGGRG